LIELKKNVFMGSEWYLKYNNGGAVGFGMLEWFKYLFYF